MSLVDEIKRIKEQYPNYSLLYVEDEEKIRNLTRNLLMKFFDRVDVAVDGEEGLSMFEKNSYDVVISDLQMPKMDGVEMLKRIRAQDSKAILIAMTAYDRVTDASDDVVECDHYLNKPISLDDFIKIFR